ncbi:hypothetical protein CyaNS01_02865 [Cyanobium sp. NS01]|nr:hypothetical protein CyaNS01_02865 [Cyanobium sp. NS01]
MNDSGHHHLEAALVSPAVMNGSLGLYLAIWIAAAVAYPVRSSDGFSEGVEQAPYL